MGDKRRHVKAPVSEHAENCLEIPPRCPTHKAQGIILATFLVIWIITPRAIRTGHLKSQFFLVEIRPRKFQPGHTYQHDTPTLATHLRGLVHRRTTLCSSRNNDTIYTSPLRKCRSSSNRVFPPGQIDCPCPKLSGQGQPIRMEINAQDATAMRTQELHGEQTD